MEIRFFEKMQNVKNLKRHPFEFYQKIGYRIVGGIPDANGIGKPDIFMAKQLKTYESGGLSNGRIYGLLAAGPGAGIKEGKG